MTANDYAQWYDLIYLLPGGAALAVLLLSVLGGGGHHSHHGGVKHGGVRHGGVKHAGPKHGGTRHSAGQDSAAAHRTPFLSAFLGLGRVPAPLVWGSALLGWGVCGFWGTQLWRSVWPAPAAFVLPALLTALLGAGLVEKAVVEAVTRWLPGDESFAVSAVDLCGLTGTAAFPVDAGRGRVHVYDVHGSLHDVSARTAPGAERIARGRTVRVTDYDAVTDTLVVEEEI